MRHPKNPLTSLLFADYPILQCRYKIKIFYSSKLGVKKQKNKRQNKISHMKSRKKNQGEGGYRDAEGEGIGVAGQQKEQKGRAESRELSVVTFAEKQRHDESKKGGVEGKE